MEPLKENGMQGNEGATEGKLRTWQRDVRQTKKMGS